MKNLKICLIGEDEYKEVSGGTLYEKWVFEQNPQLECILIDRKTLPKKQGKGTYDLYVVIHLQTKKKYSFFCGTVLEDKLKNIPMFSQVKIVFGGKHSKGYHIYNVFQNPNFRFDPEKYPMDDNTFEVKGDNAVTSNTSTSTSQNGGQGTNPTPSSTTIDEDLPF